MKLMSGELKPDSGSVVGSSHLRVVKVINTALLFSAFADAHVHSTTNMQVSHRTLFGFCVIVC